MRESSPMIKKINSAVGLKHVRSHSKSRFHRNSSESNSFSQERLIPPSSLSFDLPEAHVLELRLSQCLSETLSPKSKHQIYADIFRLAIGQDRPFSSVLARVKSAYDAAYLETLEGEKLQLAIQTLGTDIQKEKEERRFVYKKLDKLAKENQELTRGLEERAADCAELREKLAQIAQVDTSKISKSESQWTCLVAENQLCQDRFSTLEKDLKAYKKREKRLIKLVLALKARNYPVDAVYEEDVHRGGQSQLQSSRSEAAEPAKAQPEPKVPPLRLPEGQEAGFHQEFLAKMDEFSESWRAQIQSDKRCPEP
jgi:hypothetical protein